MQDKPVTLKPGENKRIVFQIAKDHAALGKAESIPVGPPPLASFGSKPL